jgi:hypothetical protein
MQGEVYHQSATPSVAPYGPPVPTIELVRRELCQHPVGTLLDVTVRSLAERVGRSEGGISPALKRLAADGLIDYLPTPTGGLVEVLQSDQRTDRSDASAAPALIDPPGPPEADMAARSDESPLASDQRPDRMFGASGCDQYPDRSACMVDHEIHDQQQQHAARACESTIGPPAQLDRERPRQVFPGEWRKIRVANPS